MPLGTPAFHRFHAPSRSLCQERAAENAAWKLLSVAWGEFMFSVVLSMFKYKSSFWMRAAARPRSLIFPGENQLLAAYQGGEKE